MTLVEEPVRRSRGRTVVGVAAVTSALMVGGLALSADRPDFRVATTVVPTAEPTAEPAWRWMSSAGIEVPIPRSWTVSDYECSEEVGLFFGPRRACDLPGERLRSIVEINAEPAGKAQEPPEPLVIDGRDAELATTVLPDGRTEATLRFVDTRLTIVARTADTDLLERILHGIRFVAIDHAGCPKRRPALEKPDPHREGATDEIIPGSPREIAICEYRTVSLTSSAVASKEQVAALQAAIHAAPRGPNRDDVDGCADSANHQYPLILHARYEHGPPMTVHVRYTGCLDRGVDNGDRVVHVTQAIVHALVVALGTPMGYHADLP